MKELKVGERIPSVTLIVVESTENCNGCFYYTHDNSCKKPKDFGSCSSKYRSDGKNIIFKINRRKMKENKHSLKISRNIFGDTTLDGRNIPTFSNDELKILKRLLTKVLSEVNQYIEVKE